MLLSKKPIKDNIFPMLKLSNMIFDYNTMLIIENLFKN